MSIANDPNAIQWMERMDKYAQPETILRVLADLFLGLMNYWQDDRQTSLKYHEQAHALASSLNDPDTLSLVSERLLLFSNTPQYLVRQLQITEELWNNSRNKLKSKERLVNALHLSGSDFLVAGQRQGAEKAWTNYRPELVFSVH